MLSYCGDISETAQPKKQDAMSKFLQNVIKKTEQSDYKQFVRSMVQFVVW